MTRASLRSAALTSCFLMFGWSAPLANGSEAHAPDPAVSASTTNPTPYAPAPSDFSLTISPSRLVIGPADIGKVSGLSVVNRGRAAVPVTVRKRNFTAAPDGALNLQDKARYSAADWLTVDPMSFEVAPGATQAITATVTVAANPEPGDHQMAIVFLVQAGQTNNNIRINRGVATPVYITVAGATDESASISDLHAPGFVMGGTVTITAKVHDTGTVHRDFRGATRLAMHAGGTETPFPDFTVTRGSTREISTTWHPPLMCVCHPTVSISNAGGAVQTAAVRVIVFPLRLLGVIAGAALVLALGIVLARRRYRASVTKAAARLNQADDRSHA